MIRRRFCCARGSITVEAAIIVPLVFLCVLGILYVGILIYHSSCVHSVASSTAQRGASIWDNACDELESGKNDMNLPAKGLYRRILGGNYEEEKALMKEYINSELDQKGFLEEVMRDIDIRLSNNLVYRKLSIKVTCSYRNPAADFLGIFGVNDIFSIKAEYEALLNDAPEFIRNTDFICDIEKEMEDKYPELKDAADEIRGVFGDVKQNIEEVFK
jgi:hypothetical protein